MSSFLAILESGLGFIKSNPIVQQYAEPIAAAVFTGSSEIKLPGGSITVSQTGGKPAKFTWGTAGLALEEYLVNGDVDFTIGTTEFKWVPGQPKPVNVAQTGTILAQPVPATTVPAPPGQ